MKHLDLFSGIGGFALAARRVGWETVAFCDNDEFCQRVLAKHWPGVPVYGDIKELDGNEFQHVDIITGGFPCQDLSVAGKQAGINAERSGLWSEMRRVIGEVRPRWAVIENVSNLLSGGKGAWFEEVLRGLWSIGYDAEWNCVPASAVGAPHRRDRVWIVAYPDSSSERQQESSQRDSESPPRSEVQLRHDADGLRDAVANTGYDATRSTEEVDGSPSERREGGSDAAGGSKTIGRLWRTEPDVGRVAHGVPARVDRLRSLGNAIVPQVAEVIFRSIQDCERNCQ